MRYINLNDSFDKMLNEAYQQTKKQTLGEGFKNPIPAKFRKYYDFDENPETYGGYEKGDVVDEYTVLGYAIAKPEFEDRLEEMSCPLVFKDSNGYVHIGDIDHDRAMPYALEDIKERVNESYRLREARKPDAAKEYAVYYLDSKSRNCRTKYFSTEEGAARFASANHGNMVGPDGSVDYSGRAGVAPKIR